MSPEPDSEAWGGQTVHVGDTPERDNPKYGAVTLTFEVGETHSNTVRITRSIARELSKQLTEYLKENG